MMNLFMCEVVCLCLVCFFFVVFFVVVFFVVVFFFLFFFCCCFFCVFFFLLSREGLVITMIVPCLISFSYCIFKKNCLNITKTRLCNILCRIFHGCKNDNIQMKNCDIILIFAQNIDCRTL